MGVLGVPARGRSRKTSRWQVASCSGVLEGVWGSRGRGPSLSSSGVVHAPGTWLRAALRMGAAGGQDRLGKCDPRSGGQDR